MLVILTLFGLQIFQFPPRYLCGLPSYIAAEVLSALLHFAFPGVGRGFRCNLYTLVICQRHTLVICIWYHEKHIIQYAALFILKKAIK